MSLWVSITIDCLCSLSALARNAGSSTVAAEVVLPRFPLVFDADCNSEVRKRVSADVINPRLKTIARHSVILTLPMNISIVEDPLLCAASCVLRHLDG